MQHTLEIRVQYNETDGQGRVHHAQYLNYFERGRVELLRSLGFSYRELEATGLMLVVSEMHVRYLGAAVFDDVLELTTRVERVRGVRIEHHYSIVQSNSSASNRESVNAESAKEESVSSDQPVQIVEAQSVVACVDRQGKVRRLPAHFRTKVPR